MILGFYLGPAAPSWLTVSEAIRNAVAPKDYVAETYPEIQSEWLCYGTHDAAVEALVAQCLRRPSIGLACAYDDEGIAHPCRW
jgi:hypothetical protein